MIACDFCRKELAREDERLLKLWTVFKKRAVAVTLTVEGVPAPGTNETLIRHICGKCKILIADSVMRNPLFEPPQIKQKKEAKVGD